MSKRGYSRSSSGHTSKHVSRTRALQLAVCETLEQRRLLATWVIDGDASANDYRVELESGNLVWYSSDIAIETYPVGDWDDIELNGHGGNDTLKIASAVTKAATISGGDGNDVITGGGGNDTLKGEAGNDTYLYAGSATLGEDRIEEADNVNDDFIDFSGWGYKVTLDLEVTTQQTMDAANASKLKITLDNTLGIEDVTGGAYDDAISGKAGDDYFYASDLRGDTIYGDAGYDGMNSYDSGLDFINSVP